MLKVPYKPLKKAQDIRDNYPLRIGVMLVVLFINLSVLWGENIVPAWYWGIVFCHTILAPHIIYYYATDRIHETYNLTFDVTMYAFYLAAWGYNPFLAAVFIATSNLTLVSLGGWYRLWIGLVSQLVGASIGSVAVGFYFRPNLALLPMLIATAGFFVFMVGIGWLMHSIHQRLHRTRSDLKGKHSDLEDMNALAIAVNSQLTIDSIITKLLDTLKKIYPLEAVYLLSYQSDKKTLSMSGVYGTAISYKERAAFEALSFDMQIDADSIFVAGLTQKRIINLPRVSKDLAKSGAAIDKKLYDIKPSLSIIYFPVYMDDVVVGGLAFINHNNYCLLEKPDLKRIASYLIQVGTAIKNANLILQLQKTKEEALAAQKKAEASEEAKSQFLANMSHEIRTPMTAILACSEALQEADITTQESTQCLNTILSSGNHLLSMINNILDISKIEANKIEVESIAIDMVKMLGDIEDYIRVASAEKGIQYQVVIQYPIPEYINNDPTRLKQVLLNICNNAIKFTSEGNISLTFSWPHPNLIKIIIEDTGIGMSQQECDNIFKAFSQADNSTTRLYGGTGLGLTISKNLAVLMGGDIAVSSVKGQGSQFFLTLSTGGTEAKAIENDAHLRALKELKNKKIQRTTIPQLKGRILVAEDNLVNQQIIRRLIELTGVIVDLVDNGQKAVEAVAIHTYDLILLDMQMPVMGGKQAAGEIRAAGVNIPMVAFTANVMTHQINDYIALGFFDVIEKPINKDKLYYLLSSTIKN